MKLISQATETLQKFQRDQEGKVGYAIAWLLGVPIPILVLIYLFRGH